MPRKDAKKGSPELETRKETKEESEGRKQLGMDGSQEKKHAKGKRKPRKTAGKPKVSKKPKKNGNQ